MKDKRSPTTQGCIRLIEEYVKHCNAMIYMNTGQAANIPDLFENKEFLRMVEDLIEAHLVPFRELEDMQKEVVNLIGILSGPQWSQLFYSTVESSVKYVISLKGGGIPQSKVLQVIGSMITMGIFSKNSEFVNKSLSRIIRFRKDLAFQIFIKAYWVLTNAGYCIENLDKFPQYPELAECALDYSKSPKEKISSNGIRALEYLLKKAETKFHFDIGKRKLNDTLKVVVSQLNVEPLKVSCNVCVAITTILSNKFLSKACFLYQSFTFKALMIVLTDQPNFKIKLHALQALQFISKFIFK